jgi:type II secretory pathway pseudopilin PulG
MDDRMESKFKHFFSERGITLVEIIASIAILSLIILTFVPVFAQSMRSSKVASDMLDSTYLAQTVMEKVYQLSADYPFNEAVNHVDEMTFLGSKDDWYQYVQYKDGAYIELLIEEPEDELSNVLVKVYSDDSKSKLEAQMETIYRWE